MAPEETELTFIRCPGCRSLVPAVATRCRMCGQLLETGSAAADDDSPEAQERKSRVRQRTVSVSNEDVDTAKEILSSSRTSVLDEEPSESTTPRNGAMSWPTVPEENDEPETPSWTSRVTVDEDRPAPTFRAEPPPPIPEPFPPAQFTRAPADDFMNAPVVAQEAEFEAAADETESFDEDIEDEDLEGEEENQVAAEETVGTRQFPRRKRPRHRRKKRILSDSNEPFSGTSTESQFSGGASGIPMNESHVSAAVVGRAPGNSVASISPAQASGELVGFFVSYHNSSMGEAIELRSGRFFIGAERLRPTDLVISDPSVSTPQCLTVCDRARGISLQDLMSEKGTYIKKPGREYVRVGEHVTAENGDWVKFGSREMLVVLLPQRG